MNDAWIGTGIKLPDDLREQFEDLAVDNDVLQAKYFNFCTVIKEEQRELVVRSKSLWVETFALLKINGEWRYQNGFVHPIDPKPK